MNDASVTNWSHIDGFAVVLREGESGGKTTKTDGALWGGIASLFALGRIIKRKRTKTEEQQSGKNDPWLKYAQGGPTHIAIRIVAIDKHRTDHRPVALSKGSDCCGANATEMPDRMAERLMGGGAWLPILPGNFIQVYSTNGSYPDGCCGAPEYLATRIEDTETNEDAVISYVTHNLGHMEMGCGRGTEPFTRHRVHP